MKTCCICVPIDDRNRTAQIEKEALAITWGCEKFSTYKLGRTFLKQTDHKPLIPLLGSKQLNNLPPRVLRFRLRLARFQSSIEYTPGKTLYIPDTLSRAPLTTTGDTPDSYYMEEVMDAAVLTLPIDGSRLSVYKAKQLEDSVCSTIVRYCRNGWPVHKSQVDPAIRPYWVHQGNLTIGKGVLLYDNRIVIPPSLQREVITKIHEGHQGIERCRSKASKQISDYVQTCKEC